MLKGSLLCPDHALRYLIHGSNGSWRKEGVDPQEALLMTGLLPPYPTSSCDPLTGRPVASFLGYGVERRQQWGLFTAADGATSRTVPELGSYYMFYDALYRCIVEAQPSPVTPTEAVRVLRVIELAKLSSLRGEVLEYHDI